MEKFKLIIIEGITIRSRKYARFANLQCGSKVLDKQVNTVLCVIKASL